MVCQDKKMVNVPINTLLLVGIIEDLEQTHKMDAREVYLVHTGIQPISVETLQKKWNVNPQLAGTNITRVAVEQ